MRVFIVAFLLFFTLSAVGQLDTNKVYVVGNISYSGNEKTQKFILDRELVLHPGDSLFGGELNAALARSRENIFNTTLFNAVSYEVSPSGDAQVNVKFTVEERWYVWPYPLLENADRNFNTWWQTKDFNRLSYGVLLEWYNFRGRNETLQTMVKVGYENQFSVGYNIPNVNKKKTLGVGFSGGYVEYREVNYASDSNKREFFKSMAGPGRQIIFTAAAITYRKSLNARHKLTFRYDHMRVDSAVLDLSSDYFKGNKAETQFLSVAYYGKYDTRDYIEYPLKGYKVETYVNKYGLGVLDNEGLNLLTVEGGLYYHIPISERFYFANAWVGKLSFFDDPPYSLQQGLGYRNFVRGYELYVMDAQNYGLIKSNVKFALMKKREFFMKWIPLKKFQKPYFSLYLNLHFDAGYASDGLYSDFNSLSNKWAYGFGGGMDIVAYYDFVMRLEYSFNRENESGFFLHFRKSI